ncbi:YggS family pyridoxal phosphate-dependent enzyme [Inquilinus sp. CAU 1745]|uniref:YggS family pyridoxal phosphate-dependent enzyme n=1 Tax=Inquilinus sp. CAU 1745 TaxID=3140369 RepID=UPI00325B99C0
MTRISTDPDNAISRNLAGIRAAIAAAATEAGRDPAGVALVAVSKVQPEERVRAALAAGHLLYGENRVQEAQKRWGSLKAEFPAVRLHLIGPLQTNKAADAVALFDAIETVDRPKLARALAVEMEKQGRRPDCLIQVNTGEEPQKAGVMPADLPELLAICREGCGLPVAGLMCIPPVDENPALHFALLAELAARSDLKVLSMGMSGDYETAIRHGATHVRVGSAIFGERVRPEA